MCGLAGVIGGSTDQVSMMLDAIAHRGPDSRGIDQSGPMVHGHVRLALRDPSPASNQPFRFRGGILSFNGELWNWRALREELTGQGYTFSTNGDTEILAAILDAEGIDGLMRIDGMFAFAWTSKQGSCWLARDAFGEIPIYVSKRRYGFAWASERKAFPPGERPIPIPPGYALDITTGKWSAWYSLPKPDRLSSSDVAGYLHQGVSQRLDADAPVCCLISGGLDSGMILAMAKTISNDVTAYTAVFDTRAHDLKCARRLCSELSVPLIEVPVEIHQESVSDAIFSIEIASKAQIEIAMLCKPLAKQIAADGFKACLSGEAADELFGGYGNFCIKASQDRRPGTIRKLRFQQLEKMSRGNFVRCNKVFMSHGVECRLPFMHRRLVESSIQLDLDQSPPQKKLLKQACKGILPDWCINRPKDTFQGGSGLSQALAATIASPVKYYNAEARRLFRCLPNS